MKIYLSALIVSLFSLFLTFQPTNSFAQGSTGTPEGTAKINWLSFEEAVEMSTKEPRKIFVDLYTSWCGWCKVMDKNTFAHPDIVDYVNKNYYAVKFNAEQKGDVNFDNKVFKFVPNGRRGYHELAYSLANGRLSYPTIVFLDEKVGMLSPVPGYQNPETFDAILKFYGDNNHMNTDWPSFQKSFKSEIQKME